MEDQTTPIQEENDVPTEIIVSNEENFTSKENTAFTLQNNEQSAVLVDIANKMAITYNVLKECIEEKVEVNISNFKCSIVDRLAELTKVPKEILYAIFRETKERNTILEASVLETPDKDILIRRILALYYVDTNKIPKSDFLSDYVSDPKNINNQLEQQLKNSGYIWRRLHNTRKAIIVEHPKQVIERQRYLKTIKRYRVENRRIVYIETKFLSGTDEHFSNLRNHDTEHVNFHVIVIAVANNNKGFLTGNIFYKTAISRCQKVIEDYIVKNVVPKLTEPAVIILENKPYYRKSLPVPTIESEKSEMIRWLELNEIPHEKTFHRSELFELIEKCRNKCDFHKFDAVIHSYGHEILRRPSKTDYLNYYKSLWDIYSINEEIINYISKQSLDFWTSLEVTLVRQESTVLAADLQMENITDKILTMALNTNTNAFAYQECEEHVDSLTQEEILIEDKTLFPSTEFDTLDQ